MAARRTPSTRQKAPVTVVDATEASIKAAQAAGQLLGQDDAALAALRVLAKKIDAMTDVPAGVTADGEIVEERKRPEPLDNVSVPTFLKYLNELGLTPLGRKTLLAAKKEGGGGSGAPSRLSVLRQQQAG